MLIYLIIDITENAINYCYYFIFFLNLFRKDFTKVIVCSCAMYVFHLFVQTLARTNKLKMNWGARTSRNHTVDVFLSLEDYDVSNWLIDSTDLNHIIDLSHQFRIGNDFLEKNQNLLAKLFSCKIFFLRSMWLLVKFLLAKSCYSRKTFFLLLRINGGGGVIVSYHSII